MRWPDDHPAVRDPALRQWAHGADELCPHAQVCDVLRYLPGRRVATKVRVGRRHGVLKVFASPRARGNHRRLQLLADTGAGYLTPKSHGADESAHVGLVEFADGTTYAELDDERFVDRAAAIGEALRQLHESGIEFDRCWTYRDEIAQLRRRAPSELSSLAEATAVAAAHLDRQSLVPSHRDFHPRQIVVDGTRVRFIDFDDAANAPAGLDVGNFVAHLCADAIIGRRSHGASTAAAARFLAAYGDADADRDVSAWRALAMVRLAGLALTRHQRPEWSTALAGAAR